MSESRIVLTDRLRSEGRWNEASEFRDRERQRLRDEGWSRREANQESWRLMDEAFPPPDCEGRASYYALADFPPECIPDQLQPEFNAVWAVYCRLKAYAYYCQPGLAEANGGLAATEARLRASDPEHDPDLDVELTNSVLQTAFEDDPLGFLDRAAQTFRNACSAIVGMSQVEQATRAELAAFEAAMPALRQALIDHCPFPLDEAAAGNEADKSLADLPETSALAHACEDGSLGDGQS